MNQHDEPLTVINTKNLTADQIAVTNSTGNIRINAVAGSGKTTPCCLECSLL